MTGNLSRSNFLGVPWKGKVVDNKDPEMLGRVKVEIKDLIMADNPEDLPWVYPLNPYGLGGKPDSGSFSVPELESFLEITFPFHDIYAPFYKGYWQDKKTHQLVFDEDYPESFGFIASSGLEFFHNKKTLETRFKFPGDFLWEIKGDRNTVYEGDVNTTVTGDYNFAVEGDSTYSYEGDVTTSVGGDWTLDVDGGVTITSGGKAEFSGKGGTDIGTGSSITNVDGSIVNLGGGGKPVALIGSQAIGTGNMGSPVMSQIIDGSSKVFAG